MKWITVLVGSVLSVFMAGNSFATCKNGYVPSDVEGVCQAQGPSVLQPSDEKPPEDKMPSWQREGVVVVDAPNMQAEDEKYDREKYDANQIGKKAAGIK